MTTRTIEPKDREDLLRHVRISYWRILNRLDRTLERSSLTARQFLLLNALDERGPTNARKLGEVLSVTPADVTGLTSRLERKGLVARLRSTTDRRLVILELTPTGRKMLEAARRDRNHVVDSLIHSMTPQEFQMMLQGLSRLIGTLGGSAEEDLGPDATMVALPEVAETAAARTNPAKRRTPLSRRSPSPAGP